MIVDSASEVLKIPESEIEAAPAMMQEGGLDCVTGLGKYKGRLIILLDINKVLTVRGVRNARRSLKSRTPALARRESAGARARRLESNETQTGSQHELHEARDSALTEAELKLLQALVYQECGMHFDDRRTPFLQDRLQRRLKECRPGFLLQLLPLADQPDREAGACAAT